MKSAIAILLLFALTGCTYTHIVTKDGMEYTAIGAPLVSREQSAKITKSGTFTHNTKEDGSDQLEMLKDMLAVVGSIYTAKAAGK